MEDSNDRRIPWALFHLQTAQDSISQRLKLLDEIIEILTGSNGPMRQGVK
jgi:hypothetical protein